MAYDTRLEQKIDTTAKRWSGLEKKKMFGGIGYLIRGNMAFGIWKDCLIVRMHREAAAKSLLLRNVLPFDITGKAMAGWIMVKEAGWKNAAGLAKWLTIGKTFALSLPEKTAKTRARKTKTLQEYRL